MAESAYLGAIYPVAFNYTTPGYSLCQGQQLNIAQNQALYAVIGVQYGGNGTTVFNLPDLRGRSPLGMGAQPGGTNRVCGNVGGSETVTLTVANLPAHNHTATFTSGAVNLGTLQASGPVNVPVSGNVSVNAFTTDTTTTTSPAPGTDYLLGPAAGGQGRVYAPANSTPSGKLSGTVASGATASGNVSLGVTSSGTPSVAGTVLVGNTGNNTAVNNMSPFLTINFLIAIQGLFPVRN